VYSSSTNTGKQTARQATHYQLALAKIVDEFTIDRLLLPVVWSKLGLGHILKEESLNILQAGHPSGRPTHKCTKKPQKTKTKDIMLIMTIV